MTIDRARLVDTIRHLARAKSSPVYVAIDGRSGVGKSTLARSLGEELDAGVVDGDDFYAGGIEVRADSPASRVDACIDWARQRLILEQFAQGRVARWHAFDWDKFDGRSCEKETTIDPKSVVILEGVYSARPELHDLLDLRVLLTVADELRHERLMAREGTLGPWERQWHEAEEFYFQTVMRPENFDLVICG